MVATYKEGITIITPTGGVPIAIARAEYYMARQTMEYDQWVISDDGIKPTPTTLGQDVFIRPFSSNKAKSFTGNVLNCLAHVKYDKVIIIESDDWYAPKYIETMVQRLKDFDLVGQPEAIYYNVHFQNYRYNRNTKHASFAETAFRSAVIPSAINCCELRESAFIDARLWKMDIKKRLFSDNRVVVGIKGMPGRPGIGIGHRPGSSYISDPSWLKLRELLGGDANYYMDLKKRGVI